jgi:hypothetical protein
MAGAKPGHDVSPETRAKISASLRGRPNGRQGYVTPTETREKISESLRGRVLSDETRAKMAARTEAASPQWKGDAASKEAKHMWVRRHYPVTGRCDECGATGRTQYAFKHHPADYTRNRDDYRELCVTCHRRADAWRH